MDGRIGSFSYLIEEVESDFFQKTAEDIAVITHKEEAKTFPAVPERFQKLATLVYQSNQHGLTKQASGAVFQPGGMDSYENILNSVAASAYWEPLGMTKSAADLLTVLEEVGVDEEELTKFAEYIFEDTIGTDALIEASMEKEAGDTRPIEEIYDELIKEASAPIFPAIAMKAGRGIARAGRAIGRAAKGTAKATFPDRPDAGTGMFGRWGKATAAEGVSKPISRALGKIPQKIRQKSRGAVGRWRGKGLQARRTRLNELRRQMMSLRKQLRIAKPGTGKAEELGTKIQDLNKLLSHQRKRVSSQIGKIRKGQAGSGIERTPGVGTPKAAPPPKKAPKPAEEGAEKAKAAATPPPKTEAPAPAPKTETKPKGERDKAQIRSGTNPRNLDLDPHGPPTAKGEGPAPVRRKPVGSVDTSEAERGAAKARKEMEEFGGASKTRAQREADEASLKAKKRLDERWEKTTSGKAGVTPETPSKGPGYREKKPKGDTPSGSDKAPGPRPPKKDVEGKGMGVMDAWTKWGKDGWTALSDAEKSRLIRAGVMAGGGVATYKTVFGD